MYVLETACPPHAIQFEMAISAFTTDVFSKTLWGRLTHAQQDSLNSNMAQKKSYDNDWQPAFLM